MHPSTAESEFADLAVLVTGGGSGIGLACIHAFAAAGARVGALDVAPAAAASVASVRHADVTDEQELAAAVDAVAEELGGLDVLVVSAGVSGPVGTLAQEVSADDLERVLAVNVRGAFLAAKHAHRWLRRSATPAVVFLGSDSSFVAAPGMAPYCASKGAVVMLARALAVDWAADRIRVNCVCPSVVDTPLARADIAPDGFANAAFPVLDADEVARYVLFAASPRSAALNGTTLLTDWGYSARSGFPA